MSRIGKLPVTLPEKVELSVSPSNLVTVKGPKGTLTQQVDVDIKVSVEDGKVVVARPTEQKRHKALHGLYRSLISNMVQGVSQGYKVELELVGVGYKATATNNILELSLGYSHGIFLKLPSEISASALTEKGKNPIVTLECIDKQLIGQVSAKIRSLRKIEPYKGKGVRFKGEVVRRKAGKTASK
ncbi:50S ribosomal protein L6 [Cytophaga hutchinsonii]|jgi:large subunit ribosomal protein L6|uniref:Large ribosomal subunit protein uL6 n=1 Tax=Cytophaga hutchinsonii (strain ATCC 33406 / DSM 1761 / CIP 103989 / NBRC 15051 / NCIMB 9469 / D465) TaxID=269798 RepID=RL6_CYTH3|nr:50S ribosomal protein L6 [Cytophaga hutchinsonii]Q11QC7.1 RecName: Full=Large ribosomal subunit protein uL6; AltName: Full=50S ribosomal protein L6 [Cytophaga hutchinsonii ATCC 33406]ABG60387.1 LSU ribosomal protein L6P [Cytophaga hutchinsonii ATCC 33406]SFX87025.1 LSU ribosomal protein L6P [Cytophaga hutchinsonii ATCC 33406]